MKLKWLILAVAGPVVIAAWGAVAVISSSSTPRWRFGRVWSLSPLFL